MRRSRTPTGAIDSVNTTGFGSLHSTGQQNEESKMEAAPLVIANVDVFDSVDGRISGPVDVTVQDGLVASLAPGGIFGAAGRQTRRDRQDLNARADRRALARDVCHHPGRRFAAQRARLRVRQGGGERTGYAAARVHHRPRSRRSGVGDQAGHRRGRDPWTAHLPCWRLHLPDRRPR